MAEEAPPAPAPAAEPQPSKIPFVEEKVGDFDAPGVKVEGLQVGKKISIDKEWAEKHKAPLERPFDLIVPKGDEVFIAYHDHAAGRGELVNIQFATADKKLKESVRLAPLSVPTEPPMEDRLKVVAQLLTTQGVKQATVSWPSGAAKSIYRTKIGDYDAVAVHGFMEDPKRGSYCFRLVGIIEAGQADGLMAFVMVDPALAEVKGPMELGQKGQTSKVIHSIKFRD